MDKQTQAAFEMFDFMDEETSEQINLERAATQAMVDRLEAKYADRGLKFTQVFQGACPVQAYGHLDGYRFYFRFRSNHARLRLGTFNQEWENLYAQRQNEDNQARYEKALKEANGVVEDLDIWDRHFITQLVYPVTEDATDYYPHDTVKYATAEGADPEDIYNGWLSDDEAFDIFSQLVDSLEDVPEEEQLDEFQRVWFYEGREAATIVQQRKDAEFRVKYEAEQARLRQEEEKAE